MAITNKHQLAPLKAPVVHITQTRGGDGRKLAIEQCFRMTDVIETDFSDKKTLEAFFGSGEHAKGLVTGKSELSFSMTVGSFGAAMLNALTLGREVQEKRRLTYFDKIGFTVPDNLYISWKIKSIIGFNVAQIDSVTSITVGGATLTEVTSSIPTMLQYKKIGNIIQFGEGNKDKQATLVYVSNGTTITSIFKITNSLTFNIAAFTSSKPTVIMNDVFLEISNYSNLVAPVAGNFMCTSSGVIYLNPSAALASGKKLQLIHSTDNRQVTSTLTALPAAGFYCYIDAPGGSVYISTSNVVLKTDAIPTETGLAVNDNLVKVTTGTPTTGQFKNDSKGYHVFAAADVADVVNIYYVPDYFSQRLNIPDNGVFIESRGVYKANGERLDRVAISVPLSIGTNQYTVDNAGVHNFDWTNAGDTFYADYRYEVEGGSLIEVDNQEMGNSPSFKISISYEFEGETLDIELFNCKSKGMGLPMKQGTSSPLKFEILCSEDRDSDNKRVWEASLSS